MKQSTHEVFDRDEKAVAGSDRSFGVVMAGALAAVTLMNAWHSGRLSFGVVIAGVLAAVTLMNAWHSGRLWPWTGGLAALCLAAALLRPSILKPLNLIWLRFGLWLKRQPETDTYWIVRQPPGPLPETMRDQF